MVFRGKFIEHLSKAHAKGILDLPGTIAKYATPDGFSGLIRDIRAKDWVVFSKKPFAGPKQFLTTLVDIHTGWPYRITA